MDPTIIRFRFTCSAKIASNAAEIATPIVGALIVRPALVSDAWNTRDNSGSSG
jgi:hypothetical protein